MIEKVLDGGSVLSTLINNLNNTKSSVFGCALGEKLTIVNESGKFILFVAKNAKDASEINNLMRKMKYRATTLTEDYIYDDSTIGNNISTRVLNVLTAISQGYLDALIVTPNILKLAIPTREYIDSYVKVLNVGDEIDVDTFIQMLCNAGYEKCELATENGTFALRGEIIDIVCHNGDAYRMMLDYDKIESIKKYSVATLLTSDSVDKFVLGGAKFFDVENGLNPLCAFNIPKAKNELTTITEFLPDELMVIDDAKACWDEYQVFKNEHNDIIKSNIDSGLMNESHKMLLWDDNIAISDSAIAFQHINNDNKFFKPNKVFNITCAPTISYASNSQALLSDIKNNKDCTIILFAKENAGANKIAQLLDGNGISYNMCTMLSSVEKSNVNIIAKYYPVSAFFAGDKVLIIGTDDLFIKAKDIKLDANLSLYDGILPQSGDIVVHNTYGVAKCLGVECLKLSSSNRDYVILEYSGGDKLYLPVENMDSIAKYIGSDTPPKLNKLGSTEFIKTKAKVKGELKELAFSLVQLYKARMDAKGFKYAPDDELQLKFENDFGYALTPDQEDAIEDIKKDMTSGKVMDRLLCGDVGFGKTEVALRAAFKTISCGKQVAFLCPTTVLSEQHYNTAIMRMKNFGVNVQVLNRFKSDKEVAQILKDLLAGKIDLLVGTHKMLGNNVKFKNLGLLILDEEQKFGVGDKEKIKNLKNNVNVLTLSATPIPRTLNMSLTGIRDISVIATPPTNRITTFVQVVEYSPTVIKNAIARELDRGGQVLVIYNKVESIYNYASQLRELLGKQVVLDVAHGQMDKKSLEDAIFRLYNGQTQVLVATTLIENGVDLPNANTLIVVDADMLGLSQLYQLKGRIGRSDKQAYAYFMFDRRKNMGENAYKRLQAITEFTAMGSGFKIAMRDLEIRGAGNVLGAEQSGHMQKVGYALYVQLLNEAVNELKGITNINSGDVRIETSADAYIPTTFIDAYDLRIRLYSKISKISSYKELSQTIEQIQNICGNVPKEVSNLCKIALIKNLGARLGAKKIAIKDRDVSITLNDIKSFEVFADAIATYDYVEYGSQELPIITFNKTIDIDSKIDMVLNFLLECGE